MKIAMRIKCELAEVILEGSGDPKDEHQIVGIVLHKGTKSWSMGDSMVDDTDDTQIDVISQ
jgi:hypothetical protein